MNDGDADDDGIPDFADGINLFGQEGDGASAPFVPMVLSVTPGILKPDSVIQFTYSASDPALMERKGDDVAGFRYTPAGGNLRIWIKDGSQSRNVGSVTNGGDFVPTDIGFLANKLPWQGKAVTLYLEGIRPSEAIADQAIGVQIREFSDAVRATVFGTSLVEVTSDSAVADAENRVLPSHPSPIVSVSTCALSNVRPSEDGSKILGTLSIAGTLTSSICDLVEGAAGQIDQVKVFVNGNTSADLSLATIVSKSTSQGSLLRPFPFSASFEGTLDDIELDFGNNTVTVTAADNVPKFGISGHSDHSVIVEGEPPNQTVIDAVILISEGLYVPEQPRTIYLQLQSGDQTLSCSLTEENFGSATYSNTQEGVVVRFSAPAGATVSWGNGVYRLDFDVAEVPDSNPKAWAGTISHTRTALEFTDWLDWSFTPLPGTKITSSNGGSLNCYAMQLKGPEAFWPLIKKVQWAGNERQIVQGPGGAYFISAHGADDRVGTFQVMPAPPKSSPAPPDDGTSTWDFTKGFCRGFFDGGKDLVEGGWTLVKKTIKAGLRYNPIGITYTMIWGDKFETEKRFISGTVDVVKTLAQMWLNLKADELHFVVSLLSGDFESAQAISKPYLDAFKACAELLGAVMEAAIEKVGAADSKQLGYYSGRATFEIVTLVVSEVKLAQIEKVALLAKVRNLPFFTTEIGARAFQKIETLIDVLRFTKICFVAGTKVHTADGLRSIETIQAGDWVLSRDPISNQQKLQRVLALHVTRPLSTYTIAVEDPLNQLEEGIECTGQHPFYSVTAKDFVPASELKIGDKLLTKDNEIAVVNGITEEPNHSQVPTYNLEIENFGTFFVTLFGIWVHNASRVTCQFAHSVYLGMRKQFPNETAWKVAIRMVEKHGKELEYKGNVWRLILKDAGAEVNAKVAAGELPVAAAESVKVLKSKFKGHLQDGKYANKDPNRLNIHHAVEARFQTFYFGIPEANVNDVPGFIIEGVLHTPGKGTLADVLGEEIDWKFDRANPGTPLAVTTKMRDIYLKFANTPGLSEAEKSIWINFWKVTRKWLEFKNIPVP